MYIYIERDTHTEKEKDRETNLSNELLDNTPPEAEVALLPVDDVSI